MAITVTSKEFNQRASYVLKLSETQPVFITKWGKIVSVLSNYRDYRKTQSEPSFEELFGQPTPPVSDKDIEDFDQILTEIRKNTHIREVELD
ncbi:type II toxin-antitoxin system Phd/YefM family antitoxin [Avibacterium paragallinarum]|uniref:Prevent-host-death family protein n=1 Tax=Avibacterium paragallinarum TaxID=728 RepID=A0AAE5TJ26_AVIPA|nr:type II toxin-antitoxin system Phd/YefM family antitoxin [Avibacterium paragallinarum]MEE3607927.1 type II toxin-antitoxin system Phd/YefM family antitoxin [Avibacterium paragallinarum]MEE3620354.1 type II toxin-antitoxin system Phd/YefM family antitoxin [Avibacterium paragallinarum]MEE3669733.1 type II toxin-antitoxin system Phd/YefM family antitoxin [Avibacterium paragallinarum]MEE3679771.1 type II toxin-antitoxin system Phd/YefM family antitoxin [Avibacterium paragallinarum]MEE4385079.1 